MGLKVGEVAQSTGLTVRTLHHYDELGLLVPEGRSWGNHRLYSTADLRRLLSIQQLRSLGLSLAEVKAALDDPAFDPSAALDAHIASVEQRLSTTRALLDRLLALRGTADATWDDVVKAIALSARLTHPEPTIRVRAALGTRATPVPVLVERLAGDPDPAVREILTWAVAWHGSDALAPLLSVLDNPDPLARSQIVRAIGKVGDRTAVPRLLPLLDDSDVVVRGATTQALARLGDPAAIDALVTQLGAADGQFRATVTDVLAGFGERAAGPVAAATRSSVAAVRRQAVEVLGLIGSPTSLDTLAERVRDPDPDVQVAALFALADYSGADADAAISAASASGDPRLTALVARLMLDRPSPPPPAGTP